MNQLADRSDAAHPVHHSAPMATGYDRQEIEQLAAMVAEKLGFLPGDDLDGAVSKLGGKFTYLDTEEYFFRGGTARIVVDGPKDFTISLHRSGGIFNNRFATAHELGHYILHSQLGKIPIKATHSEGSVAPEEWEATVFAAAFLMPGPKFREMAVERKLSTYDLSAYFMVSLEAVTRWKSMLGVA
jgi:hypothetical protein